MRRGWGWKEKEWTDCIQSDIRAFGIAGDWKAMALKAEVWVEAVKEGGWRLMAGRGAHLGTPSSANPTAAASQPTGRCISRGSTRSYTRGKDPLTLIPRNQVSEGEGTRSRVDEQRKSLERAVPNFFKLGIRFHFRRIWGEECGKGWKIFLRLERP